MTAAALTYSAAAELGTYFFIGNRLLLSTSGHSAIYLQLFEILAIGGHADSYSWLVCFSNVEVTKSMNATAVPTASLACLGSRPRCRRSLP